MSTQENPKLGSQESTQLYVRETVLPLTKMQSHLNTGGGLDFEFSDLNLTFGRIDFALRANQNDGLDINDEEHGVDVFYELRLSGRIYGVDELKWLQRFKILLTIPTEDRKNPRFLGLFDFSDAYSNGAEAWLPKPQEDIERNRYADLTFVAEIHNYNFQSLEARSKIEMTVIDKTIPNEQLPLKGFYDKFNLYFCRKNGN